MAIAGVTERLSHGESAWFARGKRLFAMFADRHHDDRIAFWCAAGPGVQEMLIASSPDKFFRPPYVGPKGWVGMYLDGVVDWEEVTGIVEEAHRTVLEQMMLASQKRRLR
jgi:predicted DNA-binding protein (MmcQ/YjbR family)